MNLSQRDRRALMILAAVVAVGLIYQFWPDSAPAPVAVSAGESVAQSEQRLARMRELAATVPAKEAVLKQVQAELAQREQGLIQADTAQQAQAQMIQLVRRLASAETPPVEIRSTEIGPVFQMGDVYGAANVSFQFDCGIEQLVNLLAGLGSQRELVAPSDLRVTSANPKDKMVGVRLTITGVVPAKLLPARPGKKGI
ncbi:MAG TPA: type II secretion system protein GspM [Bryobacteraceae bacterium]|nr:type II secretion system protein GspM [Bryobacteraceae bacterium]